MSQMFTLSSLELLLIAGRAVALLMGLLMFAWAFRHWRRAAMRDTQRVFEQLDLVRSELLIMREVMHHSHRPDANARINGQDVRAPMTHSGPARAYEIAARMARNGAGRDELMRSCGITSHEAELLVKLHGQRNDAAELIGRQARTTESVAVKAIASTTHSQTTPIAQNQARQALNPQRQNIAATTQRTPDRTPDRPAPRSNAVPRSRLVAVG